MILHKFDTLNHPARMRIFQALSGHQRSINQLARLLPDIPRPSLYRHIHKMLDAGVIEVVASRQINGIEERFYTANAGRIDPQEVAQPGGSQRLAEHVSLYGTVVAQALARYLIDQEQPNLDAIAARDHFFFATDEEFKQLRDTIYQMLREFEQRPPAPGRRQRRMFVIAHPLESDAPETTATAGEQSI